MHVVIDFQYIYLCLFFLQQSPDKMSPPSRDEENAGYEGSESEDLSASIENTADNEIGPTLSKEKPLDINDTNFIFVI